jgi:hypothetical protein
MSPSGAPSTDANAPASGASPSTGSRYTSVEFAIPLSVTVPTVLAAAPIDDTPGLLTWTANANDNNQVRFLSPAEVYPAKLLSTPMPAPADMLSDLHGLSSHGAWFTDEKSVTVGGIPAHLMTAHTLQSMDGTVGCPVVGADQAEGCFGLQPEVVLRMAVLDVHGKPLLIWARTDSTRPDAAFLAAFESMLSTVEFR